MQNLDKVLGSLSPLSDILYVASILLCENERVKGETVRILRILRYKGSEDQIFNRVISDISVVLGEITPNISDSRRI